MAEWGAFLAVFLLATLEAYGRAFRVLLILPDLVRYPSEHPTPTIPGGWTADLTVYRGIRTDCKDPANADLRFVSRDYLCGGFSVLVYVRDDRVVISIKFLYFSLTRRCCVQLSRTPLLSRISPTRAVNPASVLVGPCLHLRLVSDNTDFPVLSEIINENGWRPVRTA